MSASIISHNEHTVTVTCLEQYYMLIMRSLRSQPETLCHAKCPHCGDYHIGRVLATHPELSAVTVTFHE
jgi:hypothetical protein